MNHLVFHLRTLNTWRIIPEVLGRRLFHWIWHMEILSGKYMFLGTSKENSLPGFRPSLLTFSSLGSLRPNCTSDMSAGTPWKWRHPLYSLSLWILCFHWREGNVILFLRAFSQLVNSKSTLKNKILKKLKKLQPNFSNYLEFYSIHIHA